MSDPIDDMVKAIADHEENGTPINWRVCYGLVTEAERLRIVNERFTRALDYLLDDTTGDLDYIQYMARQELNETSDGMREMTAEEKAESERITLEIHAAARAELNKEKNDE